MPHGSDYKSSIGNKIVKFLKIMNLPRSPTYYIYIYKILSSQLQNVLVIHWVPKWIPS